MNAADVREALHKRWPSTQNVVVEEAPEDPWRSGRKIDMLVLSCWKSRAYDIDAVEIKVSLSDWKRELDKPHKADFWWRHSHRFWLAVPKELGPKVCDTLPTGWGLLLADPQRVTVGVQAKRHGAEPMEWPTIVGVMRANQGAGMAAIGRARQAGYEAGRQVGLRSAVEQSAPAIAQRELEQLRAKVEAFAKASGVDLVKDVWGVKDAAEAGVLYQLARNALAHPDRLDNQLAQALGALGKATETLNTLRGVVGTVLAPKESA